MNMKGTRVDPKQLKSGYGFDPQQIYVLTQYGLDVCSTVEFMGKYSVRKNTRYGL